MAASDSCCSRGEEKEVTAIVPLDIWSEILVRLPVKPLHILKCVAKSFLTHIESPEFVSKHLVRFNTSFSGQEEGSQLLLLELPSVFKNLPCSLTFENLFEVAYGKLKVTTGCENLQTEAPELEIPLYCGLSSQVVSYADGFLLMYRMPRPTDEERTWLSLWNPSLRKSRLIPLRALPSIHACRPQAFGYDSETNDYKMVFVFGNDQLEKTVINVYSLGMGSFTSTEVDFIPVEQQLSKATVYTDGVIHWLCGKPQRGGSIPIVSHVASFNLGSNSLSLKELPYAGNDVVKLSVSYMGKLAVLYVTYFEIIVWMLKDDDWTKECTMESVPELLDSLRNSAYYITNAIFFEKSGELLVSKLEPNVTEGSLLWYNTNTKKVSIQVESAFYADVYKQSLVWPTVAVLDEPS